MVVCKPVYDFTLKNGLRSRWKVLESPKGEQRPRSLSVSHSAKRSSLNLSSLKNLFADKSSFSEQDYNLQAEGIPPLKCTTTSLAENDYFCIVSWQCWAVLAQITVEDEYIFNILLKDHNVIPPKKILGRSTSLDFSRNKQKYGSHQHFRIVAHANSALEIVNDWNTLMEFVMPKVDQLPSQFTVYDLENIVRDFYLEFDEQGNDHKEMDEDGIILTRRIKHYRIIKELGKGSFAQIKLAQHEESFRHYALKLVPRNATNAHALGNEIAITLDIGHPHVIRVHEVIDRKQYICMVLTYCQNGTLSDYIDENFPLPQEWTVKRAFQLTLGLEYLHSIHIIHRDIKPENVLLDTRMNVRISDFGLAERLEYKNQRLKSFCGTLGYLAPEIATLKYLGQPVDIFSLGVTLYYMLNKKTPYPVSSNDHNEPLEYLQTIEDSELELEPDEHMNEVAVSLIQKLIDPEPLLRPKMSQILKHKWFCNQKEEFNSAIKENVKSPAEEREEFILQGEKSIVDLLEYMGDGGWKSHDLSQREEFKSPYHTDMKWFSRSATETQVKVLSKGMVYSTVADIASLRQTVISRRNESDALHVIENLAPNMDVLYIQSKESFTDTFQESNKVACDFCLLNTCKLFDDGRYIYSYKSVEHPACPIQPGIRRAKLEFGGYYVQPLKPGICNVTFTQSYDINIHMDPVERESLYLKAFDVVPKMREIVAERKGFVEGSQQTKAEKAMDETLIKPIAGILRNLSQDSGGERRSFTSRKKSSESNKEPNN